MTENIEIQNKKYRKKCIQDSIRKWENIEKALKKERTFETTNDWVDLFWNSCGYCDYYVKCEKCPLAREYKGTFVCFGHAEDKDSYAHKTLKCAEVGNYTKALELCKVVLDFMRKDLKGGKNE